MIDMLSACLLCWTLAATLPPPPDVSDVGRLPSPEQCQASLELTQAALREDCYHHPAVSREIVRRYRVWFWLADAHRQDEEADPVAALSQLRSLVGFADYYAGRWPSPLPWELFLEVP